MKYIDFEGSKISKLSLGTVQFGLDYGISNIHGKPSRNTVNEIVQYVSSNGINCFDTAQAYGNSEKVLGEALEGIENKLIISKIESDLFEEDSAEHITNTLVNLSIDTLYGLLLHDSNLLYHWKDKYTKKVNELLNSGKIKHFGVSIYTFEDFNLALENDLIKVIQIPFNLFDKRAYQEKWFEKAEKHNKLIFIRSIYLQGLLLMEQDKVPSNLQKARKYLDILDYYVDKLDLTRNELALSYVDTIGKDALVLFGCDTLEQAKENIDNYNSIVKLETTVIEEISKKLADIDEKIYNPTKW